MTPAARLAYLALALVSVASSLVPPFAGIEVLKAAPTALLVAVAARGSRPGYGVAVTLGVAMGSVGDFLLATASPRLFVPGMVAFLVGHLAYIVAFLRRRDAALWRRRAISIAATILYCVCAAAWVGVSDPIVDGRSVAWPVIGYVAILGAMTVAALVHRASTARIAWGAAVFVLSDSHIPINFFVLARPALPLVLTGYATYYLAQYLIVDGACRASGATANA
ncbi:MAG: lysoplasmalogenase [bacterium]